MNDHDIRQRQAQLAHEYGIDGFIYHHYWFYHEGEGATLAAPLENMLMDGEPDISFAFNWAKANWWEYKWPGYLAPQVQGNGKVLVEQITPDPSDPRIAEHYSFLKRFFHHKNYIKVNGVPLFLMHGKETAGGKTLALLKRLREMAIADGFPAPGLHIAMQRPMSTHSLYTASEGNLKLLRVKQRAPATALAESDGLAFYPSNDAPPRLMRIPDACREGRDVGASVHVAGHHSGNSSIGIADLPSYLGIVSFFDNTPRRTFEEAFIYDRGFSSDLQLTPSDTFRLDLLTALTFDRCCQPQRIRDMGGKFVMVNAWNEWGEGMALEPSTVYGCSLLELVRDVKRAAGVIQCNWTDFDTFASNLPNHNET